MNLQNRLEDYAKLLIKKGVNIQKGQKLVIRSPIEVADFTTLCAKIAYEEGAKEVDVLWNHEELTKLKFQHVSLENLSQVSEYIQVQYDGYREEGAAILSLVGENPALLQEIDPEKIKASAKARSLALKKFNEAMMSDEYQWCVAGVAVESWASYLFEDLEKDQALEKLWTLILDTSRVDAQTMENWNQHLDRLTKLSNRLNEEQFDSLVYSNNKGTDLKVGLPENHIWSAAKSISSKGVEFVPNIPTEEVFTLPHKDQIEGLVYSAKPLNYGGNIIDDFKLRFEEGKIVEFDAKKGRDILAKLVDTDEGSKRLGEVALVPYDSPISNTNLLFFNTLYDENASCHLAIGKAYPTCLEDFEGQSLDELKDRGANDSLVHEDFMVGTEDLSIVGIKKDGQEIQIFKDGNFAPDFI